MTRRASADPAERVHVAHSLLDRGDARLVPDEAQLQSLRDALTSMGVDYTLGLLNEAPRRVSIFSEAQWI